MNSEDQVSWYLNDSFLQQKLCSQYRRRDFLIGLGTVVSLGIIQQKRSWASTGPNICWRYPEELVTVGFKRSRVVMMNEAHSGAIRNIRSREIGRRILPTAHAMGVRHIAMEALTLSVANEANATRQLPSQSAHPSGYLAHPEMRSFIQAALDLGWTLIPYEINFEEHPSERTFRMWGSRIE